jgi:uncharacterized protein YoxC
METLYHSTHRTIQEIQQLFQQLNNGIDVVATENDILNRINTINA